MARSDVLVTADWAESNLRNPGAENVVFVEVDEDTSAYDVGHIAGADQARLARPTCRTRSSATSSTSSSSPSCSATRGIANDDTVVLYGGNNNWFAAYAYWYFKLYGHDNVKLLDGGRKKWELDGRALSKDARQQARPPPTRRPAPDNSIRAFRDEVIAAINVKNLVDVRSPDEFSGKILAPAHLPQEQSQRPGHIPGAINVPWSKAANEDGTFKSDEELARSSTPRRAWTTPRRPSRTAGSVSARRTPGSCCSELLGHQHVKNYDGSWTEYGSLVGAPIELGK